MTRYIQQSIDQVTCELAVVVGAGRVLLVGADWRAGRRAGAEAGVAQGRADLAGLAAVVHRPLDVQGGRQRGALLGLQRREEEERSLSWLSTFVFSVMHGCMYTDTYK